MIVTAVIELWYSGAWHDITADVFQAAADPGQPARITRGRDAEGGPPNPAKLTLSINNGLSNVAPGVIGRYSPRNPHSDLYGLIGRNTPIRIRIPALITQQTRIVAEVTSWPARWNAAATVRWVEVEASGILRRLMQGTKPAVSPLRRATLATTGLAAYWPLEDPAGSVLAANAVDGGESMRRFGTSRFTIPGSGGTPQPAAGVPEFASGEGIPGSAPVLDLSKGGTLWGPVPRQAGASGWRVEWVMRAPRDQAASRIPIWWETTDAFTSHPVTSLDPVRTMRFEFQMDGSSWALLYGRNLTTWGSAGVTGSLFDGQAHHYRVDGTQSGGNILVRVYVDGTLAGTVSSFAHTMAGTVGQVDSVVINPLEATNGDASMPVLGHVAVWSPPPSTSTTVAAATGHTGELAGIRFARLCADAGLPYEVIGDASLTARMGPQPVATLVDLLQECADADGAVWGEQRSQRGLRFRCRADLYNQDPLTLTWSDAKIAPPLEPTDDDAHTRNDVTVTRATGGTYRVVQENGPLNVNDPTDDPDGVGRYDTTPPGARVNVANLSELRSIAWWLLSAGTLDEPRFTAVRVLLTAPAWLADPTGTRDAASLDGGDLIEIRGLAAAGLPPDPVQQLVQGMTETIDPTTWDITWSTGQATLYRVGVLGETTRVSGTSETTADFDAGTDTALTVTGDLWITTADHPSMFPLDVMAAGVRLTVTGVTGATNPQTMTVDQAPVNGVVKTVPAGSAVTLAEPWRLAR